MKMIPAIILLIGAVVFLHGILRDNTSSFEDGTFLIQLMEIVGGAGMVFVAVVWFLVLVFLSL